MKLRSVAVVAVLALAAALVARTVTATPRSAATNAPPATATAPVTRGTVTERVQIAGTLGYDGAYTVSHLGPPGVLTRAPEPGAVVGRGEALYAVDGRAVRLLLGPLPAYRGFQSGMADGPDVRQLERNLADLGLDPGRVDDRFTASTAAAIRRLQARWGTDRSGALARGDVVFLPGPLRVSRIQPGAGAPVAPGQPVVDGTSTDRAVTAALTTERQQLVHVNDSVQVSLGGAAPFPGTVVRIGRVATAAPRADGRGLDPPTVPLTIRVTLPPGSPDLDQAPVQVSITTRTKAGVLLVPVTALLARPGGGYQVRRAGGEPVEVRPGLFDASAGTVEVTGELREGEPVEVPVP